MQEYYEQLYDYKLDNSDEMINFKKQQQENKTNKNPWTTKTDPRRNLNTSATA